MKTKIVLMSLMTSVLLIASVMVVTPAADNGLSHLGKASQLYLFEKDSNWNVVEDGVWGKMTFDTNNFVFNGHDFGPTLDRIELIHYKDGKVKVMGGKGKLPTCYTFLTKSKIKWQGLPVRYVINPTNIERLSTKEITSAISTSAETWDLATTKELFNDVYSTDLTVQYGANDGKNSIIFGDDLSGDIIAVTNIWYNPRARAIVDFDIKFNSAFVWGVDGSLDKMDLQNIATHELGHGVGLGDVYSDSCSAVTMYGYSTEGDVDKRTLEQADIKGLTILYGI